MYSEAELIQRLRQRFGHRSARVGIGDDAAVLDVPSGFSTLVCSDLLAEGTHFRRSTHPPDSIGFKAVAVNVSDIGAMGGKPTHFVLSLGIPSDLESAWIDSFLNGLARAEETFEVELVGGDSAQAPAIFVDVAMIGKVRIGKEVRRSGARIGDGIYVTGHLGGAALGLQMLEGKNTSHPSVRRQLYPEPRHRLAQDLAPHVTAMIDLSDGLSVDLGHIVEDSHVSARIEAARVPRHPEVSIELALHGGEDYELVFTSSRIPADLDGAPVTRIGEVVPASPTSQIFLMTDGTETVVPKGAWQHFRS